VVVHTNLGRSLLPEEALDAMIQVSVRYSNLEYDLVQGRRGSRYSHVEQLLCELTGAEAALVVNNNAAAVLLTLETLAKGREVVVSRGELVEIGGSFRIPDVMARSGAILKEVGATNRTHLRDYAAAIGPETALLMKVHQSNFAVVGFTSSVTVAELKELAMEHGLAVFEDLGSGNLVDLTRYGFMYEPTVQEAVAAGADVVSFSGDKMLGGPQAGIIVGRKEIVDQIKKNPMNRAVRIDKLTLAALESVLRIYRDPMKAVKQIPTLRMLTAGYDEIRARAVRLKRRLARLKLAGLDLGLTDTVSRVGGGALPLQELRSVAVALATRDDPARISSLEARFREASPPLIVRMENERILMDCRTVQERDMAEIPKVVAWACDQIGLGASSGQDRRK
jgi:L-seryl-tRNA(Ser) seleniumtransferase